MSMCLLYQMLEGNLGPEATAALAIPALGSNPHTNERS